MIVSLFLQRSKVSEIFFPIIFHRAHLVREGKLGGHKKDLFRIQNDRPKSFEPQPEAYGEPHACTTDSLFPFALCKM